MQRLTICQRPMMIDKKIIAGGISTHITYSGEEPGNNSTLLILHGFSGSSADFEFFISSAPERLNVCAMDLVGHGRSGSPESLKFYTPEYLEKQILNVAGALGLERFYLLGYSMGGRAALNFTLRHTSMVQGLILESSSPGIEDETERQERYEQDLRLATFIETNPIDLFAEYWMNIPLFASQKLLAAEILKRLRESKLKNNKIGLANMLRGFSTGIMPHMWNEVSKLCMPVLLLTGELDEKFTSVNKQMCQMLVDSGNDHVAHRIVPRAGHNIHLERPDEFIHITRKFLANFIR